MDAIREYNRYNTRKQVMPNTVTGNKAGQPEESKFSSFNFYPEIFQFGRQN